MGYVRHHAILVTSWSSVALETAHAKAVEIFAEQDMTSLVSPIVRCESHGTFMVAADGKEGWEDSNRGDAARSALVNWLDTQRYEDGSTPLDWAEVQYGDDNDVNELLRDSGHPRSKPTSWALS